MSGWNSVKINEKAAKKNLWKTCRKPGELLIETTLIDSRNLWLLGIKAEADWVHFLNVWAVAALSLQWTPSLTCTQWGSWRRRPKTTPRSSSASRTASSPNWTWTRPFQRSSGHVGAFRPFCKCQRSTTQTLDHSVLPASAPDVGSRWGRTHRAAPTSCVRAEISLFQPPRALTYWWTSRTTPAPCRPAASEARWLSRRSAARSAPP